MKDPAGRTGGKGKRKRLRRFLLGAGLTSGMGGKSLEGERCRHGFLQEAEILIMMF
jgi:hypothetical protein